MTTIPLSEIAVRWQCIEDALEESGGEATPEVEAALAEVLGAESEKVDSYGFIIRALEGQEASFKKIEVELANKRATVNRRKEWLCTRMYEYLKARGGDLKVKGPTYTFSLQKNGGAQPLELLFSDPVDFPMDCWKAPQVDEAKVRAAISQTGGDSLSREGVMLARLLPRGLHLRLR